MFAIGRTWSARYGATVREGMHTYQPLRRYAISGFVPNLWATRAKPVGALRQDFSDTSDALVPYVRTYLDLMFFVGGSYRRWAPPFFVRALGLWELAPLGPSLRFVCSSLRLGPRYCSVSLKHAKNSNNSLFRNVYMFHKHKWSCNALDRF